MAVLSPSIPFYSMNFINAIGHIFVCALRKRLLRYITHAFPINANRCGTNINLLFRGFRPIFNLLYFYPPHSYLPAYYRIFSGNVSSLPQQRYITLLLVFSAVAKINIQYIHINVLRLHGTFVPSVPADGWVG